MANISRRDALSGTGAGFMIFKPETVFGSDANSRVSFGIIGTGGRGRYVGTHMTNDKNAKLTAICDIYPDKIDQAKTLVPGADSAKVYKNYKDLLADKSIDAVLIATPVFLHPEHFEAAVEAGKNVYCEKPAGADVAGVKRLVKAAQKADKTKVYQFGFQQRFSPEYLKAEGYIRSGKIGEMKLGMSFWILGNSPMTSFTSKYPEEERKIRHWGMLRETSGGAIVEQDCHGIDVLNWYLDGHPAKAVGTGGVRYPLAYGDWTSDHHNITYTYPNGKEGWLISIKHTAGFRDVKEQFFGSQGVIDVGRTYMKLHGPIPTSPLKNADDLQDRSLIERQVSKREITIDAIEHFYQCIVDMKPYSMAMDAANSTFTALLGRMAYETKREVTWDELIKSA